LNYYNPNHDIKFGPDISNGEIDFIKLANSIWRGKFFILFCVFLFVLGAEFYIRHIVVSLYSATASIALEEGQPKKILTDIESVTSNGPISDVGINTELEVLRSRNLVKQLIDKLDLTSEATFNPYLREPTSFDRFSSQIIAIFGAAPKEPKSIPSPKKMYSSVVNNVLNSMQFSNIPNTRVINISVKSSDGALSVLIANTMAELYIENQVQVKLDVLANATEFLSTRTSELKHDFEKLKSELANFSNQSELSNSSVLESHENQLRDLRTRILEATDLALEKKNMRTTLKSLRKVGDLKVFINKADDFRLNRGMSRYRNNRISIDDLNFEIDRFLINIDAEIKREQNQLLALQESEAILASQIERQSQELIILQQLERETEAARLLYESFFRRSLEMNVQLGLEAADGRLLSKAYQNIPSGPIKSQILLKFVILGFLLGAGLVLLKEIRFSGFRSINELYNNGGHNILASIPLVPKKYKESIIPYLKNKPNSVVSEAVRNLRTSILMSKSDQIPKVIMLTSSVPKEGKSVLTFALAQNMIGLGKRVLLIESDIRRRVHSIDIDRSKTVSLIDLLLGNKKFKDVNLFVEDFGFDILTASRSDVNAADLFSSQRFSKFLTELRDHYDYILLDSPPVLAVPDARLLGANADANIYIVEWNKTTRAQLNQGLEMFSSVGVNITGLVLNQVNAKKLKTFGYISSYGYNAYGSEYYDS